MPGDGKSYPDLWSLKEFHMPTPDRPVHTNPHTDTHMHGENKYFPYQSAPSLIPQVGSLQRGGAKCSVFRGWGATGESKDQILSPFAGWRLILGSSLEGRVTGNQLFFCKPQPALSQREAKSRAVSLKQNLVIVLRYFKGERDRV